MKKGKMMVTALMVTTPSLFYTPRVQDTHSKFSPFSSFERLKPVFERFVCFDVDACTLIITDTTVTSVYF